MKTALITGANKSIGYETAHQLLAQGYFVFLGSRDAQRGAAAVKTLQQQGFEQVAMVIIDVTDASSVAAAVQQVTQVRGGLDVLINNAGVSGGFPQSALTTDVSAIKSTFETNFFGAIQVTQAFLPLLQQSAAPRIVNVTSGLGSLTLHSNPDWKYYAVKGAAYGPSKTALNAYTVTLAYELRDTAFKVNVVDPGYTATDFNHHSGPGAVTDAAAIIAKYAMLAADGPTGRFFSNDIEGEESPW